MRDCDVEVLMPSLGSFATGALDSGSTLEQISLQAAEAGARELVDVYVGETLFVLVIVRAPEWYALQNVVSTLEDVHVCARPALEPEDQLQHQHLQQAPPPTPPPPPQQTQLGQPSTRSPALTTASQLSDIPHETPKPLPSTPASVSRASDSVRDFADPKDPTRRPYLGLPILKESKWVSVVVPPSPRNETGGTPLPSTTAPVQSPRKVVCKGLWVVVRPPLDHSTSRRDGASLMGKQRIIVTIRERSRPNLVPERSAHDAVELASRLAGPRNTLTGEKIVAIHQPLEISCQYVPCANNGGNGLVAVTARNTTTDAWVSVVPPHIDLASSLTTDEEEEDAETSARTHDFMTPIAKNRESHRASLAADRRAGDLGNHVSLEHIFEFAQVTDDLEQSTTNEDEAQDSTSMLDDLSTIMPSVTKGSNCVVSVGPREIYEFLFLVLPKGSGSRIERVPETRASRGPPLLSPGKCFQTPVVLAWACYPRGSKHVKRVSVMQRNPSFPQDSILLCSPAVAPSRSNVALRSFQVRWAPPSLMEDVILTFSGPRVCAVGSTITVSIIVTNQSRINMNMASVHIQRDAGAANGMVLGNGFSANGMRRSSRQRVDSEDSNVESGNVCVGLRDPPLLMPLHSVIGVGAVPAGCSATVRVQCVAFGHGIATLGNVFAVDAAPGVGAMAKAWHSKAVFETFVVNPAAPLAGDPSLSSIGADAE